MGIYGNVVCLNLSPADPYLNTDAGTMSPFEHGEVYVLDDGGEVNRINFLFFLFHDMQIASSCPRIKCKLHNRPVASNFTLVFILFFLPFKLLSHFTSCDSNTGLLQFFYFCFPVLKVDLDLGNYERFLDIKLTRDNNITTGKIYQVMN